MSLMRINFPAFALEFTRPFFVVSNLMKLVHLDADTGALKPMLKDLREAEQP
jgi:hypothetical protein